MKVYVGNVTLDTSLKLTKSQAEKLGQYLIPYKNFKIMIFDCIMKIEDTTFDLCNRNFNLETFLRNLYVNADTITSLIKKYLALKELIEVDFYSLGKAMKEMENLFYSVTPKDPFNYASPEECEDVSTSHASAFLETDHPMDYTGYYYGGLRLYVPDSLPGNYSCFVKAVGKALEDAGIYVGVDPSRIYFDKTMVFSMPGKQPLPMEYVFPFLYKLANNESFREKFVEIAKKIEEAVEKKRTLNGNLIDVKRKLDSILFKSAGMEEINNGVE